MNDSKSVMGTVYTNAAQVGRFWVIFRAIVTTLVGIIAIVIGVYVLIQHYTKKETTGIVLEPSSCLTDVDVNNGKKVRLCNTKVEYEVDGENYVREIPTGTSTFEKDGDNIQIWYHPDKPGKPEYERIPEWVGWVIILITVLVIIGAWFWVWLTRKYQLIAAAEGVSGISSMFM